MTKFVSTLAAVIGLAGSAASPALALNNRTWVSGTGTDAAGCGPIASPCRTLQYAHDQTNAGGEIDVKDSAGYGSVVIDKAITILGDGSIAGVLAAPSASAITVNAGAGDDVLLKGLAIEGTGVGTNGIIFNSGASLVVANCLVRGFTSNGVYIKPTSGTSTISVVDTILSNDVAGFTYNPTSGNATAKLILARVVADGNTYGIVVISANQSGGSVAAQVDDTVVSNNSGIGISGNEGGTQISPATMVVDNARMFNNATGIAGNSATIFVSRSAITSNTTGIAVVFAGSVKSYGDNRIDGNTINVSGNTLTSVALK